MAWLGYQGQEERPAASIVVLLDSRVLDPMEGQPPLLNPDPCGDICMVVRSGGVESRYQAHRWLLWFICCGHGFSDGLLDRGAQWAGSPVTGGGGIAAMCDPHVCSTDADAPDLQGVNADSSRQWTAPLMREWSRFQWEAVE
jgi:hypothetical protein